MAASPQRRGTARGNDPKNFFLTSGEGWKQLEIDIVINAADAEADAPKLKFYGQFDPPVDKFLYDRYFSGRELSGVVLECGAFDGITESSCRFFEESLGWQAINIEASPSIYAKLVQQRPQSRNLNVALSNQQGQAEFVDVTYPGYELCTNGSLSHLQAHREWLDNANCTYTKTVVPTCTFKDLVRDLALERLDLMVLDIEGHELQALQGFAGAHILPDVLCVEHGHLGVNALREVIQPLGYCFDTTSHVNSFYVLQGNCR